MSFRIFKPNQYIPPKVQNPLITGTENQNGVVRDTIVSHWPFAASSDRVWSINLPDTYQSSQYPDYNFAINIDAGFCEFQTGNISPITGNILSAISYKFSSNLIYDSTWNPQVLPPGGSIGSTLPPLIPIVTSTTSNNPGVVSGGDPNASPPVVNTIFSIWFEPSTRLIKIKADMNPNYYISGIFTIKFGDIYPAVSQNFETYKMIVKVGTS